MSVTYKRQRIATEMCQNIKFFITLVSELCVCVSVCAIAEKQLPSGLLVKEPIANIGILLNILVFFCSSIPF